MTTVNQSYTPFQQQLHALAHEANERQNAETHSPSFVLWVEEQAVVYAKLGRHNFSYSKNVLPWTARQIDSSISLLKEKGLTLEVVKMLGLLEDNSIKVSW